MKTALITGSSRGIGKETALIFARHGWNVVIHGFRHPKQLQELEQDLLKMGVSVLSFLGDIGDPEFVRHMAETSIETFGSVDCLVNNASISLTGLFTDSTLQDWDRILHTNLISVFAACKYILPHMIRNHAGKIINISSIWGSSGASCEALYSATKGAVNAFTKALAKETALSNIQVNAVAFGMIDTDMNKDFDDDELAMIREEIPADYIASPKEAAEMIYHTAAAPDYMTGQILTCSGGWYI